MNLSRAPPSSPFSPPSPPPPWQRSLSPRTVTNFLDELATVHSKPASSPTRAALRGSASATNSLLPAYSKSTQQNASVGRTAHSSTTHARNFTAGACLAAARRAWRRAKSISHKLSGACSYSLHHLHQVQY